MPYPITKRDGKYYVNGHGYRTRGQALAYQRALYAHMPENEKPKGKADDPAYQRGIQDETAEHPTMTPDIIAQLVKDHLRIDPNYYAEEEKFNPNHEADTGRFATGEGGGGFSGGRKPPSSGGRHVQQPRAGAPKKPEAAKPPATSNEPSRPPKLTTNERIAKLQELGRQQDAIGRLNKKTEDARRNFEILYERRNSPLTKPNQLKRAEERYHKLATELETMHNESNKFSRQWGIAQLGKPTALQQRSLSKELVDAHGQTLHGPSQENASLYGPLSAPGVAPGKQSSIIRPIAKRPKKKFLTPRPLPFWKRWGQRLKEGITVTHGGDGLRYMFIITSNSYPDREDETITTRALQEYVDQAWEDGSISQPLRWWHDDELPDIGKIVWADMEGPFLLELAQELPTKLSQIIFDYIEQHPDEHWAASHGFDFPEDDKTASGVYKKIYKFETSLLPLKAAANPYTMSAVVNERTL